MKNTTTLVKDEKSDIMNTINENYRNLIEDFLMEKEELLKKLESKGAHALRIKALKSEIRRCKRVLDGKQYDRKTIKEN